MHRRNFIKQSSIASLLLTLHPEVCFSKMKTPTNDAPHQKKTFNLIANIRLLTATPLEEMKDFYLKKMDLSLLHEKNNEVIFQAGASTITFVQTKTAAEQAWYHFAFNIPENKILQARNWQLKRTALVSTPRRLRDAAYPDDIRHFRNWNAHSIFFWDPAGNLLEFIARHDLQNGTDGDFSSKDIINVSEMAFVVDEQEKEAKAIYQNLGIEAYPKGTDFWWSMGDENGLLLCIRKRLFEPDTTHAKWFGIYKTEATINGASSSLYQFENYPYQVKVKSSF